MISFLASPKPFEGVALINQTKAIQSWLALDSDVEVTLYGDSKGTEQVARKLGVTWIPDVAANEFGTPLFGAIAKHAAAHARHDLQVYINCDIILTPGFIKIIQGIHFPQFLMIGQRIDLAEGVSVEPMQADLFRHLMVLAKEGRAVLHPPVGSDYFIFRRGAWSGLPPVVIGRGAYDNALIAYCLLKFIPVIDASKAIIALHQFHDYAHLKRGQSEVFLGQDATQNLLLCRELGLVPTLEDATGLLVGGRYTPSFARGDWLRAAHVRLLRRLPTVWMRRSATSLWAQSRKLGFSRPIEWTLHDILSDVQR